VVRNEKNPRGDSIAERYGPPVTASDIEDLMYKEHVPSSSIYKIMQAVRQALSWSRASGVRPWAGELEDGLTRQEDRRAAARKADEERRAQLAEALRDEGRARAAAESPALHRVNSYDAREALADAVADAWAEEAERERAAAPGRHLAATQALANPSPGTITPAASPEPPRAVPAPRETEIVLPTIAPRAGSWLGINRELFKDPAQAAPGNPPGDAPARPAAPPKTLADPAPAPTPPPALPEPATALVAPPEASEPPELSMDEVFAEVREQLAPSEPPAAEPIEPRRRKTCSKCHTEWDIDFFQRDKRSSDGKRPECRRCSSRYDAMRRSLKKSLDRAVDVAVDAMQDAESEEETDDVQQPLISELTPEPVEVESYTAAWERPGATVLIPRFDPPIEAEVPGESPDERRKCTMCGVPKLDSEFYTRSDGRIRHQCADCERKRSRARKMKSGPAA
jgi:hypothetical protein